MSAAVENLWNLTTGKPEISPAALGAAIGACLQERDLDFRTRLLIRDSVNGLDHHWSRERLDDWLNSVPNRRALDEIRGSDLGPTGFPSLGCRLMEPVRAETVRQFLRELGVNLRQPTRLEIDGAIALILTGNLSRGTEDIDVVNEVPAEIRSQHELLAELEKSYGIRLTHFQSHFLPSGWEARLALQDVLEMSTHFSSIHTTFLSESFPARVTRISTTCALWRQTSIRHPSPRGSAIQPGEYWPNPISPPTPSETGMLFMARLFPRDHDNAVRAFAERPHCGPIRASLNHGSR
ncbi:MAG TPA: hypothetical protein VFC46_09245 [Humisphaera sp.]|nr:hypothetical protein [Humisphaera sp.]